MKPPHNVAFLERAIRRLAQTNEESVRLRVMMANVIAGQFLEVSYDEVGDADACDVVALPEGILKLFGDLGLPQPHPVPLMKIAHQIAQKLHGVTDTRTVRVQDLIDLQLMFAHEVVDLKEIHDICMRLFANRKLQPWPSRVVPTQEWSLSYNETKANLPVLPTVDEAVAWANDLIAKIDAAK